MPGVINLLRRGFVAGHMPALLFLIVIINCSLLPRADGAVYQSVTEVINHFKDQTVTVGDLDGDAREYFITSERGKTPGIVRADFNGDGKEDVALLTYSALLFFICNDICKQIESEKYGGFGGFQYIAPVRKGAFVGEAEGFEHQPASPPVRLKNTAVRLIFYGKASIIYHWDSTLNSFRDTITGD